MSNGSSACNVINEDMCAYVTASITSALSRYDYNKALEQNFELDFNLSFSSAKTFGFNEQNIRFTLNGIYKTNNNITFGSNVDSSYQSADIHVGLFNETIDKNINLNANLYAQFNNKLKINVGYELNKSLINAHKDYSFNMGLGYVF